MHFNVASRGGGGGTPLTLASQQRGHVLIVPIKSLKNFLACFAGSVFINKTLIRPLNFSVFKSYFVLVVLLLQLLSY